MSYNCPHFITEFQKYVVGLGVSSILEVGCWSGDLKDAVGAGGIDVNPARPDVVRADIRNYTPNKKYDLLYSSGVLEHYTREEAVDIIRIMAGISTRYVLTYVPSSECPAYLIAKSLTSEDWGDELDYTPEGLAELHRSAGMEVVDQGYAAAEWSKRFGPGEPAPYLVYVLAQKKGPL